MTQQKAHKKLGIIAGGGTLPQKIVAQCQQQNREYFVVALKGHALEEWVNTTPHSWVRMGAAGKIIEDLKQNNVKTLVLAGGVRRPSWAELRPDAKGAKILAKIGLKSMGDDGLLKVLMTELEKEGFELVSARDILPDMTVEKKIFTRTKPDDQALRDIERGWEVLKSLSTADVGQAVIIQQGLVLGVEAIEGTAALIQRCGDLKRDGAGGVLVKISKEGQDLRVDMPTIGVETIEQAAVSGLRGVALEAGKTQILDQQATIQKADDLGLFVMGVSRDQ